MNGITEEADPTVYSGKVIRPLRSVDPTQTEYQGMIEVMEDGKTYCFYLRLALSIVNTAKYSKLQLR